MRTIGAFEAKTHFSQLLDRVAKGETVVITRHGEPVAELTPVRPARGKHEVQQLIKEILEKGKGQDRGRLPATSVKELIDAGRKY